MSGEGEGLTNGLFSDCKTEEEVKLLYRERAKKHHPDRGGSAGRFKLLNAEYQKALKRVSLHKQVLEAAGKDANVRHLAVERKPGHVSLSMAWSGDADLGAALRALTEGDHDG